MLLRLKKSKGVPSVMPRVRGDDWGCEGCSLGFLVLCVYEEEMLGCKG